MNSSVALFHNFSGRDLPDYSKKKFNSMLVENGKIIETDFELETRLRYADVPKIDLQGAIVFPAFADAHVHFMQTGLMLQGCSLDNAVCIDDVLNLLSEYQKKCSDEWILAWNLDETNLRENRLPTLKELDRAVGRKRLWLSRVDLHSAVPNTAASAWARNIIPDATLEEGRFVKKTYESLTNRIMTEISREMKLNALRLAKQVCLTKGVSTIHALEGGWGAPDDDVQMIADYLEQPGFHGVLYHQSEDPSLAEKNGWPRLGGCLFIDGSFGSRTAALSQPYFDDETTSGIMYRDSEQIEALVRMCGDKNLQLAMHAIGDKAIHTLVSVHRLCMDVYGKRPLPHRIEHFELPLDRSIQAAKEADLYISVQPAFEVFWGGPNGMYSRRLGSRRTERTNPFKTLLNCGLPLAGGSDSPVTPVDPFLGIHGFVNHPTEDERIDLNSALAAFTLEPHRFAGEDGSRGRLRKGYRADFVCLGEDPFNVPDARIKDIHIAKLFIDGEEKNTE